MSPLSAISEHGSSSLSSPPIGFRNMIGETIDCRANGKRSDDDGMDFTTSPQQPLQEQRRVTFRNSVAFREIPHLNDLDEQDVASIWYTPQDYQLFKAVCKVTVKMIMKHGCQVTEEDPELCCRGLETKTQLGSKRRNFLKVKVRRAVFREQDSQFEQGIDRPLMIAEIATICSKPSVLEAHQRALDDARQSLVSAPRYDVAGLKFRPID